MTGDACRDCGAPLHPFDNLGERRCAQCEPDASLSPCAIALGGDPRHTAEAMAEELLDGPREDLMAAICRVCGCTSERPCDGGCVWAETDLCSRCIGRTK